MHPAKLFAGPLLCALLISPLAAAAQTAPKTLPALITPDKVETRLGTLVFRDGAPGKGWFVILRLYSPLPPFFDKVFQATTDFSPALYRTQLFDPADIDNVKKVQAGYQARPLSAFLGNPAPAAPPAVGFPKIDKKLVESRFFEYLGFLLPFAPPAANKKDIRAKLASIGVGPEAKLDVTAIPQELRQALAEGMKAGAARVEQAVTQLGNNINGWVVGSFWDDRAFFDGNWPLRAAGACAGIYGNNAEEATYPVTRSDGSGQPLDGSKHSYTLTFPKGQLPPVNAFWSVTMYHGKTQLLIKNPINRYLINSPMLPQLKKNADGSLTIYIQKDSPGPDKESNWLPAPDGPIYMALRLYWPKVKPPSVLPPGKGSWNPPAIKVAP